MIDRNTNNVFTHLGLFEGIGGFSLAARWMGWKTLAWCEWNEFGQKVLKHHFPEAEGFGDITKTDFTKYANKIDILTGGFPCQPYSLAGKRKGKEDERHLWPEMLRAIREVQPRYVVGENVSGLINWNGGLVFNEVQADLEAEGYEVQPFVLPACGVNAPHRRDRVWFVAHAKSAGTRKDIGGLRGFGNGCSNGLQNEPLATDTNTTRCEDRPKQHRREPTPDGEGQRCTCGYCIGIDGDVADTKSEGTREQSSKNRRGEDRRFDNNGETWDAANTRNKGLQGNKRYKQDEGKNFAGGEGAPRTTSQFYRRTDFEQFPTQSPICSRDDGLSAYSHNRTIQNENTMDRTLVIKSAIDAGRLIADIETGKIYSTVTKSNVGDKVELKGADCNGYRVHNISFGGIKKQCRAHQIVWIYANGVYDKDVLMIDHINRDKSDNRLCNLRLVDAKGNRENVNEYEGKLTQDEKDTMYFIYSEGHMSIRELAEDFGISKSRVHQLLSEHKGLNNITFSKWRNESIKAAGNAIVPQVAYQIFKSLEAIDSNF
jgi:DNA (cytosine-5)-methyltransferase 1